MREDGIVEIGGFTNEASAWLGRAVLDANGIVSEVVGMRGAHALPLPRFRLAVRADDAQAALKLIEQAGAR